MKILVVTGFLLSGFIAMAAWTYKRQYRAILDLQARLVASHTMDPADRVAIGAATLPAPVDRYLRLALGESNERPDLVEIRQFGELRTDEQSERWLKFTAVHRASPLGCGFFWNARVQLAPAVHLCVVDSLVNGQGSGQVLLQSIWRLAQETGTPQMNSGALHRFLAEAVWYPWALVPNRVLRWDAIDGHRSLATLACGNTTVSLEFRFNEDGTVAGIYTPTRWGRFHNRYEQVPWEGQFSSYEHRDGVLVPSVGEVGWYRNNQLHLVWRGIVEDYKVRRQATA